MNQQTIDKLNQFQIILKSCIQDRFKNILPQEHMQKLTNTNYVNIEELKKYNNGLEIQGDILRRMLDDIINVKCKKELNIGNEIKLVEYGELLERILIEYYAIEISNRYQFQIKSDEKLREKFSIINEIKNVLKARFDEFSLNKTAREILDNNGLEDIKSMFDVNAIEEFNNSNIKSLTPQETNDTNEVNMTDFINNSIYNQSANSIVQDANYEELVMKYARGEKLTDEELKTLLKSTPNLMNESQIEEFTNKNTNQTLELSNSNNLGFSYLKMTIYFIVITSILGFIIATIITQI